MEFVERKGKAYLRSWRTSCKRSACRRGGYVIVNVLTGDYVSGASKREALAGYRASHKGSPGWASRIEDVGMARMSGRVDDGLRPLAAPC